MKPAAFFLLAACLEAAGIEAGAAKRVITPDLDKYAPVYMAGFGQNRKATGVHDDLYARCIALRAGGAPLVMCGVDSIGLFIEDVEKIRAEARRQLQGPADIVIGALHDHESPDAMGLWGPAEGQSGINDAYNQFIVDQTAAAIVEAVHSLRPATLTLAKTHPAELDSFIDDNRPPVVHDAELLVLSASDAKGPIVTLVNWANHPETLGDKNTLLTADYPAHLYTRLEQKLGGMAVFINGAVGGMQSPLGARVTDPVTHKRAPENSFRKAEIIGARLADLAAGALASGSKVAVDKIEYREKQIEIPVANDGFRQAAAANLYKGRKPMTADGTRTLVGFIRLSAESKPVLEAALVPGELYPELSVGGIERYPGADFPDAPLEPPIKSMMSAPYRMLFGLANDEIGYIIPKAEWDNQAPWLKLAKQRWYGEVNSVGPEAAPIIAKTLRDLISN